MTEEKNTIKVIDDTIDAVQKIIEALNTAKSELNKLEQEKEKLSNDTKSLENDKNKLEAEKKQLEEDKKALEEATKKLEQEKAERDQRIGSLTEEQQRLLKEYESLKVELTKIAKVAEQAEESEFNFERIKALLSIYAVLIDEIWQGQPHYRILLSLHGEREQMTRDDIKMTTGISGVMVLRAIHELANIDLVDFDEDTDVVKLKRRLFEREALEDKKGKKSE